MSQSYTTFAKKIPLGDRKGQIVYNVRAVSYGTLSTDAVAKQISQESTATTADVKAVLDRYAYYVVENLRKGYSVELLGFGTVFLRFITKPGVTDPTLANAKQVKSIVPDFRPSFTRDRNGKRTYDLIPERVTIVKFNANGETEEGSENGE